MLVHFLLQLSKKSKCFEWNLTDNVCCQRSKQVFVKHVLAWMNFTQFIRIWIQFYEWKYSVCMCMWMCVGFCWPLLCCCVCCFVIILFYGVVSCPLHMCSYLACIRTLLWLKTRLKSNKPEYDVFSITLYLEAFSSQYFFVVWCAFTQLLGVSALKTSNIKYKWIKLKYRIFFQNQFQQVLHFLPLNILAFSNWKFRVWIYSNNKKNWINFYISFLCCLCE